MWLLQLRDPMSSWETVDWDPDKSELERKAEDLGFYRAASTAVEAASGLDRAMVEFERDRSKENLTALIKEWQRAGSPESFQAQIAKATIERGEAELERLLPYANFKTRSRITPLFQYLAVDVFSDTGPSGSSRPRYLLRLVPEENFISSQKWIVEQIADEWRPHPLKHLGGISVGETLTLDQLASKLLAPAFTEHLSLESRKQSSLKVAEDKALFEHEYITIRETEDGYTYYEYDDTVGILPYRRNSSKPFLIRKEPVPSWGGGLFTWAVYGGTADKDSIVGAAVAEVEEEAGFVIQPSQLIDVGKIYRGKNSTGITYLFLVDVTEVQQQDPEGDGSEEEDSSLVQWVDENYIQYSECPILHSLLLKYYLRGDKD